MYYARMRKREEVERIYMRAVDMRTRGEGERVWAGSGGAGRGNEKWHKNFVRSIRWG